MEDKPLPPPQRNATVLLRSEADRVNLASVFKQVEGTDFYMILRPSSTAAQFTRSGDPPAVLIVDIDASDANDISYIRALRAGPIGHVPTIALVDGSKQLAAIGAIRAGADDVILKPANPQEVREALIRVAGIARPSTETANLGRLIAFVHVTGGVGATTLAVNSATALANTRKNDVCLLDLDVQYGNAGNLLDIRKASPVEVLIDEPARLDRDMLESMMIKHDNGVQVLTSPELPFALSSYRSDMVANLIQLARRRYSMVVVDLPVALAPWTDVVLREASVVYLICTPNVASVHRVVQFLRLMDRENLGNLPFRIVLNRHHDRGEGADVSESQFAKAIGRSVDYRISNDYGLISLSHNQGRPAISLKPNSRFSRQLTAMLAAELGESVLKPVERSWWQRSR
jgi:pilus assembly protein CpaE